MSNKKIKIFIIAGEVSGDVLGAKIMREMPDAEFVGIGGENMAAAGLRTLFPISDLAVMGFFEVIAHAKTLLGRIDQTASAIIESKPDIVLTIDSPSFAKRVIKKVKSESRTTDHVPRFYHVVAPQVWAWGAGRAKKFAKIFDRLYSFFDFEAPYFTKYGLDTIAVGHPIADGLHPAHKEFNAANQNIALIPGSRISEVKKLLLVMRASAEKLRHDNPNIRYNFYIPVVETTKKYIEKETADWRVKPVLVPSVQRYKLYENTDIAIAASGTISAELAIMHIPAVVIYKMNPLTMWLARRFVKIKWVSLVNILLNKTVYAELLGADATPDKIVSIVEQLADPAVRKKMIAELAGADKMWKHGDAETAAHLIAITIKN